MPAGGERGKKKRGENEKKGQTKEEVLWSWAENLLIERRAWTQKLADRPKRLPGGKTRKRKTKNSSSTKRQLSLAPSKSAGHRLGPGEKWPESPREGSEEKGRGGVEKEKSGGK